MILIAIQIVKTGVVSNINSNGQNKTIEKSIISLIKKRIILMIKNKTFKTVVKNGRRFNLMTLPDTNFFKFEVINKYGSNIERVIKSKTAKNLYGISHLIEHLGFKSSKDFTTEELLTISKNEGDCNASTSYDRINYWFKTTADNMDLAINFICNIAFNDLTMIDQKEFDTEKSVVYNEAKRAADDHQMMFHRNTTRCLVGYEDEDNTIGIPETIDRFTLEDAIAVKNIFLTNNQTSYNIIYDSNIICEDEVLNKIMNELDRFETPKKSSLIITHEEYLSHLNKPRVGKFKLESKSEQAMTNITLDAVENTLVSGATLYYLSNLAENTSLDDLIRQKNGLSYGVQFYMNMIAYKPFASFICDVSVGKEEELLKLFKESINLSADAFSEEKYNNYMKTAKLKRIIGNLNLEAHGIWFYYDYLNALDLDDVRDILANNMEDAYSYVEREIITYSKMKESMETIRTLVNNDVFGKVYT